jgi:hypothetical protein
MKQTRHSSYSWRSPSSAALRGPRKQAIRRVRTTSHCRKPFSWRRMPVYYFNIVRWETAQFRAASMGRRELSAD